jgi:hypothetical protein
MAQAKAKAKTATKKAPTKKVAEEVQEAEVNICGHVNRHSFGVDGKPDNLQCTLPKGHDGLHSAQHYEGGTQLSGMLSADDLEAFVWNEETERYEGIILRHWNDMAGIPAKDIKPAKPGETLLNADHMFGVGQQERISELEAKLARLEKLLDK